MESLLLVAALMSAGAPAGNRRVEPHQTGGVPSAALLERAGALFREAREAIDAFEPNPGTRPSAPHPKVALQAMLLIELAKSEVTAFPDAAAGDAARAFVLARALPGRSRDFNLGATPDTTSRSDMASRMLKTQLHLDTIKLLVYVRQAEHALQLARDSDVDRADLFDAIVRAAPENQILTLAAECRAADGSYPYIAIADRARRASSESVRKDLLEHAYSTVAAETEFKQRSMALSLVSRTYDLVPPELAFGTLADLMQHMLTRPSQNPGSPVLDRDVFGPEILAVMMAVDPQRAASVAADHRDWDAARKIPGKTSLNPIGGPGPGAALHNAPLPPAPPPRPSSRPLDPMTQAEFEQALTAARSMPPEDARVAKLTSLGYLLLTSPPR